MLRQLSPQDRYVSTTGVDAAGNGTLAAPWKTINYACSAAALQPGDVINVKAGVYNETVSFGKSGVAGSLITLRPLNTDIIIIEHYRAYHSHLRRRIKRYVA